MTADMAFECLLVCRDPHVFTVIDRLLRQLSISMNLCLSASKALCQFAKGCTDLIVIDCEDGESTQFVQEVQKAKCKKPTVVAITSTERRVPGAHIVLTKPITSEQGAKSLKVAYSQMLRDHRRHARCAVMKTVIATDEEGQTVPITITDIGDGGVGLSTKTVLTPGQILGFRFQMPGISREILVEARVLWSLEHGRAGCEFARIPPIDRTILHDWLEKKIQVKKPLIPL